MSSSELVRSLSIESLLVQREGVRQALEVSRDALLRADQIIAAQQVGSKFVLWRGVANLVCDRDAHGFHLLADGGVAWAMKRFDAEAWRNLLHASGLRSFMDASARKAWDKQIEELRVPELSLDVIRTTFAQLYSERGEMFERGVVRAFKSLSWEYKTNLPQRLGKRIVLRWINGYSGNGTDKLDDLLRVMHVLDGKPEPDHRYAGHALLSSKGLTSPGRAGKVENEYIRVTVYKNQNGHVEFLRPDLVDGMNRIIASHYPGALAAPAGTKPHGYTEPPPDFTGADLDFYPTPPEVAAEMMVRARVTGGCSVLEPSAGTGALAAAARAAGGQVHCIEIDPGRAQELRDAGHKVDVADFLEQEAPDRYGRRRHEPEQGYDAIVMNPPFSQRRDVRHVTHAAGFLKPGGRLVAVMGAGVTFRTDELTQDFRRLVDSMDGSWKMLPPGTFKAAGTNVNAVLVTLRRPD